MMRKAANLAKSLRLGSKLLKQESRCLVSAMQDNIIVNGKNGEKIIKSPFGDVQYPELSIPEYVFQNFHYFPNHIATECGVSGRKYTYANVRDYSNYIGRSLRNIGLKAGDVVAMIMPNLPESPIVILGCIEAGFVLTTVNPAYTPNEISRQLVSSGAVAVITSAEVADTVSNAIKTTSIKHPVIVIDDHTNNTKPDNAISFKDLIEKGKALPEPNRSDCLLDDVALLPYSSGTTGLPKGVMLTHRNIVSNIEMTKQSGDASIFEITSENYQDVCPAILPVYHIYGLVVVLLARLSTGSKIITLPKFTPESFVSMLENHQATSLLLVPPIVIFLSTSKLLKKKHIDSVRFAMSGAAPLCETDIERFYQKFERNSKNLKFFQGYGMTELSPVSHFECTGTKLSSIGKPIAGTDCRIVSPVTKKDVDSFGECGELWIRGANVMKGYLNNEEATKETIKDGWLLTGDIGYYDKDYDFYITERLKELIKVKGYQVAPAELEALLRTHPKVLEAAVIGVAHPRYGEVPKAFISLKSEDKISEEEIQNFVKGKVSEFKELRGGVQFIEEIPKNPTGKILRKVLKDKYC